MILPIDDWAAYVVTADRQSWLVRRRSDEIDEIRIAPGDGLASLSTDGLRADGLVATLSLPGTGVPFGSALRDVDRTSSNWLGGARASAETARTIHFALGDVHLSNADPSVDRLAGVIPSATEGDRPRVVVTSGTSRVVLSVGSGPGGPDEFTVTLARRGGGYLASRTARRGATVEWSDLCSGPFMFWAERLETGSEDVPRVRARHAVWRVTVQPASVHPLQLDPAVFERVPSAHAEVRRR